MKYRFAIVIILLSLSIFSFIPSNVNSDVGQGQCARSEITNDTKWFNDRGIDQPENWINMPSAMRFGIYTYVVWQGGTGFVPCIARYNHVTGLWGDSIQLANSNPIAGDGHGAPTVFITPSGKILITYGAHISALKYIRGDVSTYPSGFVTMSDIISVATYPHFTYLTSSNRIFMAFRSGDACSAWNFMISNNDGTTWTAGGNFLQVASYVGGVKVGDDGASIYFEFATLPNCSTDTVTRQNAYIVYYLPDNGNAFWCKTVLGDTQIGFVVSAPIPVVCRLEVATSANFGDVVKLGGALQTGGNVYVSYSIGTSIPVGTWQYRFAIWNGTVWNINTISYGDHFQDYNDFRVKAADDVDAYVLSNATDFSGSKEGGILDLYHWNGASWNYNQTILSPNQTGGNLLTAPFVPQNGQDEVFFDERVISLTVANSKLYLWNTYTGFEGLTFIPSAFFGGGIRTESILLILIFIALFVAGLKWPIFWIFSVVSGFLSAAFLFRDIQSVAVSAMISGVCLLITALLIGKLLSNEALGSG